MTLPAEIRTLEDVLQFFTHLSVDDKLGWHPDDDLSTYGHDEKGRWVPAFTKVGGERRNELLEQAWGVLEGLGFDIYCVAMMNDHRIGRGYSDATLERGCEKEAHALGVFRQAWTPRKRKSPRAD
jgi:hypothetical protein